MDYERRELLHIHSPLDDLKRMEKEARDHWNRVIRETGASPLWWKLMRNPKFRAAVEAEAERIYLESIDELVKRRANELAVTQELEEEYQRRLKAPGRQLAAKVPEKLNDLLKRVRSEQESGVTYGTLAEYRQYEKHFAKARERGDRIIILGKHSGAELKKLLSVIHPKIDTSCLKDTTMYGGDLMIIGLEPREFESWLKHLGLWGMNDEAGMITKTVQMKWGESSDPQNTEHQITYAGIQLSGLRDETALPMGHREISIGLLNPAHPWDALAPHLAGPTIISAIKNAFKAGKHEKLNVPEGGLYPFVSRVVIRTTNWTHRFQISGNNIICTSSTRHTAQHRQLLADPRPGKPSAGTRTGTLIKLKVGARIQVAGNSVGQKAYSLTQEEVTRLGITLPEKPQPIEFEVDHTGKIIKINRIG
ncbi:MULTISPECIES: hypothetical protein [Pseudomonas]|uniref:hypothetical protein n=1 Tax=Pseudomonas TaxID=286 RepID=UPI000BA41CDB|nr:MULTISPECIES: hypothetical protein [Pseudomonas]MBY8934615.1 hypothetical protein [Pseudomonas fluorescens]